MGLLFYQGQWADELETGLLEQVKIENLELVRHTCMLCRKKKDHREVVDRFIQLWRAGFRVKSYRPTAQFNPVSQQIGLQCKQKVC